MKIYDALILGGGVAGLAAADVLSKAGKTCLVLESQAKSGGLMSGFEVDGYTFDNAVHLSFAEDEAVRQVFDEVEFGRHIPIASNWADDRWIAHPVQNNLHSLNSLDRHNALASFLVSSPLPEADADYGQWLDAQFGKWISSRFHRRYTQKYWRDRADNMSTNWIKNRIKTSDPVEIITGAYALEDSHYFYAQEMRYPLSGGYGGFLSNLQKTLDIRLNSRVVQIDPTAKQVHLQDGESFGFGQVFSSIPLPEVVKLLPAPPAVLEAAGNLQWTSVDLVSYGFSSVLDLQTVWFYIYDEDLFASRAYAPHLKAASNTPTGKSSLQFEIYRRNDELPRDWREADLNCRLALDRLGVAAGLEATLLDTRTLKYGNVHFYMGMEEDRGVVLDYLSQQMVSSIGRFGEWDYLWSHQSFMSGRNAALLSLQ